MVLWFSFLDILRYFFFDHFFENGDPLISTIVLLWCGYSCINIPTYIYILQKIFLAKWQIKLEARIHAIRRKLSYTYLLLECKKQGEYTEHQHHVRRKMEKWYRNLTKRDYIK